MTWQPRVGDRVEYSEHGLRLLNPLKGQRRGTVVGKGHAAECVRVLWDGRKCRQSYWAEFLCPAPDGPLQVTLSPVHQSIIQLCKEGKTAQEIAATVGRCVQAIYPVLRKAGLTATRPPANISPSSFWTDTRCAVLTKLWDRGHTASAIARVMNITRNAVIGKAHRLGLSKRASPIRRAA